MTLSYSTIDSYYKLQKPLYYFGLKFNSQEAVTPKSIVHFQKMKSSKYKYIIPKNKPVEDFPQIKGYYSSDTPSAPSRNSIYTRNSKRNQFALLLLGSI